MTDLGQTLYTLLLDLNMRQFFSILFNQYFPYGMFFWMLGFIIFAITHLKTKNLPFAAVLMAFYFVAVPYTDMITNVWSVTAMQWSGLIIGAIAGYYAYKAWRG
jgi:hypothetical protein